MKVDRQDGMFRSSGQGVLHFVFVSAQAFPARLSQSELKSLAQISGCVSQAGG
jgi:hypothetical protein